MKDKPEANHMVTYRGVGRERSYVSLNVLCLLVVTLELGDFFIYYKII